jgi:hypothetical protein
VLGLERANAHCQLVSMILVLTRVLAHPIETFTQAVAAGQQAFALLVVLRHGIQRVLQLQA